MNQELVLYFTIFSKIKALYRKRNNPTGDEQVVKQTQSTKGMGICTGKWGLRDL